MKTSTVVIVFFDRLNELDNCLASIDADAHSVVVVDTSPRSCAQELSARIPQVTYLAASENRGYGWACNLGVARAVTECVVITNSDVVFLPGALEALENASAARECIVAPMQVRRSTAGASIDTVLPLPGLRASLSRWLWLGRKQETIERKRAIEGLAGSDMTLDVTGQFALSGACLAMSRRLFLEIGGFDEEFFLFEEDIDISLRVAGRGGDLLLARDAMVVHESGTNDRGLRLPTILTMLRSERILWSKHRLGSRIVLQVLQAVGLAGRMLAMVLLGRRSQASVYRNAIWEARS